MNSCMPNFHLRMFLYSDQTHSSDVQLLLFLKTIYIRFCHIHPVFIISKYWLQVNQSTVPIAQEHLQERHYANLSKHFGCHTDSVQVFTSNRAKVTDWVTKMTKICNIYVFPHIYLI